MHESDWDVIEDLFLRALDLAPDERAAFLVRHCGDNTKLRGEVESMLAAEESGGRLRWMARLEAEARPDPATAEEGAYSGFEGDRIGPYEVVRLIGSGGMGRVYLAQRADDQYRQQVALKIVRDDFAGGLLVERFRAERQILAQLRHPNISTLLDGGVTAEGRPFLVMQYEEGLPITEHCDEHRLTVRERLELFATVCDAVHFAHSNLVVHRDLKPSNILVADDGVPKLLDFGIAKILEGGLEMTRPLTQDVRLFSPDHAAPEQLLGGPITTATDVYALGILLYELMVGERPFRSADISLPELHRQICEESPTRPSDGVAALVAREDALVETGVAPRRTTQPGALIQTLRGDLDQIVLKALRKEPERRYPSAGQLAEDVRRYLAGMPVTAQPDSSRYRLGKFVRRHRAGVAAAASVAGLIVAFALTMTVQSRRLAQERDRTALALDRAEEVGEFLVGLFSGANPTQEPTRLTAIDLLDRGLDRAEELEGQPEVQADMFNTVGRAYAELAQFDKAEPLLERALAMRRELYGDVHEDVAWTLNALASARMDARGDFDRVEPLLQEAVEIRRQISPEDDPDLALAVASVGSLQYRRGALPAAEESFRESLEVLNRADPPDSAMMNNTLSNLGLTLLRLGKTDEAESALRAALAGHRALLGEDHPNVAGTLNILGELYLNAENYSEAEAIYLDVLERRTAIFGPDHPAVATVHNNLAQVFGRQSRFSQAIPHAARAVEIQRASTDPRHPLLGLGLKNLGALYLRSGELIPAEAAFLESLDINRANFDDDHPQVRQVRERLVELYTAMERPDEAARYATAG